MNCPKCNELLNQVVKYNITIDYCPECGTVVLDKGEIEKILEEYRKEITRKQDNVPFSSVDDTPYRDDDYDYKFTNQHRDDDDDYKFKNQQTTHQQYKRKRESFLEDIFDIF